MKSKTLGIYCSCCALFICSLAHVNADTGAYDATNRQADKYRILERDQIDNTDTLAIPFDESEIEDERQINALEKKEVFPIPQTPASTSAKPSR